MARLAIVLLVLLGMLQYRLWFGDNALKDHWQLKADIARIQTQNAELKKRNDLMYAEVKDLRKGLAAVEERARNELGLIRDGETFYRVLQSKYDDKNGSADNND
ncbi:cell division protein FtsB [Gallaecimonas pentaromativorans]|uniref:Cell division protein FtsB n=1 Tax=Gallaecimonas pentaromativorans TaxID=584787 RepID=A0A3N1PAR8_9GAMM|nr:cell division protein FtsB [Gallaecimonas pentaromativorans]MED5526375.1 cell division protein FtsB [Pseudomonadota bacterium]ROQ25705.1 cell division protein FtsB [Gallaecimonas pentaromativorans]